MFVILKNFLWQSPVILVYTHHWLKCRGVYHQNALVCNKKHARNRLLVIRYNSILAIQIILLWQENC